MPLREERHAQRVIGMKVVLPSSIEDLDQLAPKDRNMLLKTVIGLIPAWQGEITFEGTATNGSTPARNVARGITFAPQGNRVFDELSVMENLEIGGFQLPRKELKPRIDAVLAMFPILRERARQNAGKLSGGEQQMLAVARALVPKPKLLMLDEPSLGLSPNVMKSVFSKICQINRESGTAILIVEQKVRRVLEICHRVYSIKLGKIAFAGRPEELLDNPDRLKQLFL